MPLRTALLRDFSFMALLGTILFASMAALQPKIAAERKIFNYIFVVDITQSMNARDYQTDGLPADRLSFVKASLEQVLQQLPCNSKAGLALFTSKNVFLLFEPLEVCQHYAAIAQSLSHIDWRMAWDADSHIARGLYTAIHDIAASHPDTRLVFFSDGQQTPAAAKDPAFLSKPGEIQGLVVGVGSLQPVPVPKFDRENLPAGYWLSDTAENRSENSNTLYISALQESALQRLAGITGLQYHRLETPQALHTALLAEQFAQLAMVRTEISWIAALLALVLFITPYFFPVQRRKKKPMSIGKLLIIVGVAIAVLGVVIGYAPWLLQWFGKLPGDIRIEDEKSSIFIPITSMLIISIVLTLIVNLFFRR